MQVASFASSAAFSAPISLRVMSIFLFTVSNIGLSLRVIFSDACPLVMTVILLLLTSMCVEVVAVDVNQIRQQPDDIWLRRGAYTKLRTVSVRYKSVGKRCMAEHCERFRHSLVPLLPYFTRLRLQGSISSCAKSRWVAKSQGIR
ncbi:hypothetical protein BDV97DRAFT_405044, partial [Delphinella strobiligena]